MKNSVPVAVIIPTYGRELAVFSVLEKLKLCDPKPAEVWVHIDSADGTLERALSQRFPNVQVLTSSVRLGPGGGRHRCLLACNTPYAASFDDDSYPVDADFFSRVEQLFADHPQAAIFAASIWHRNEPTKCRTSRLIRVPSYIGCGQAIRLAAYQQVRGWLPRPVAYGMEENDLSLQLFAAGWHIYEAKDLRVFHDTALGHRESPEITSGTIINVALCAFLHYPAIGFARGFVQVANIVWDSVRRGRFRGICSGLLRIPMDCYRHRHYRKPIDWPTLKLFLQFRRTGVLVRNSAES